MKKSNQKALLYLVSTIAILGVTTYTVVIGMFHPSVFALAFAACFAMVKYLWQYVAYQRHNTIRLLRKWLPKVGFTIENVEWNEQHTAMRLHGKYQGDNFTIHATHEHGYVYIYDHPWYQVNSSDPTVPRIMESMNEVNTQAPNMSVVMSEPNDEGMRYVYTVTKSILPTYHTKEYLESLMGNIRYRKCAMVEALNKERPYMTQRRGPVGFNVENASPIPESQLAPAAETSSDVRARSTKNDNSHNIVLNKF